MAIRSGVTLSPIASASAVSRPTTQDLKRSSCGCEIAALPLLRLAKSITSPRFDLKQALPRVENRLLEHGFRGMATHSEIGQLAHGEFACPVGHGLANPLPHFLVIAPSAVGNPVRQSKSGLEMHYWHINRRFSINGYDLNRLLA